MGFGESRNDLRLPLARLALAKALLFAADVAVVGVVEGVVAVVVAGGVVVGGEVVGVVVGASVVAGGAGVEIARWTP